MMMKANSYFKSHLESDAWSVLDDEKKQDILLKSQIMIDNSIDLRNGTKELDIYDFAIFEQAIFLLTFDKERSRLQREGVNIYKVDDLTFHMNGTSISPVSIEFLRKYTYKKLGEVL